MRKFSIWLLMITMLTGCLSGCGKTKGQLEQEIIGKTYDTGQFQVLVPEPWRVIPITDPFSQGRPVKTDSVFLRKGGQSDWRVSEKPYIRIECYGLDEQIDTKIPEEDLQHNPETVEPMTLGDLVWSGYTADSYQGRACIGRFALLWAEDGAYKYQVLVWFESGGESVSLEDRDLQACHRITAQCWISNMIPGRAFVLPTTKTVFFHWKPWRNW